MMAKWHKIKKKQSKVGSSRNMRRAMRKLTNDPNMNLQEIEKVNEVVIRTSNEEIIIKNPQSVSTMEIPGQGKIYQIFGGEQKSEDIEGEEIEKEDEEEEIEEQKKVEVDIPLEDVKLVAQQAGVNEDQAREVLKKNEGDLAKSIIELKKG
jgi:nascent polypeptide-associated complex subunit alpha